MTKQIHTGINSMMGITCAPVSLDRGDAPYTSTRAETDCDPTISQLVRAVDTAFALHNKANGSTVSVIHGNMARRRLFSVSPYPARTVELWERPTWQEIFDFALANWERLLKPQHALGTWFNDKELVHVLDVAVCCADRAVAIALAKHYRQSCIYDLATCQEIHLRRLALPSQPAYVGGHDA